MFFYFLNITDSKKRVIAIHCFKNSRTLRKSRKRLSSNRGSGCNLKISNRALPLVLPHFKGHFKNQMMGSNSVFDLSIQNGGLKSFEVPKYYKMN